MKSAIKRSIIPFITLSIFLSNQAFSQNENIDEICVIINQSDLTYTDGLYYYEGKLYSGAFYSNYNTDGPNGSLNNGYSKGKIKQGEREGKWSWYVDNVLVNSVEYKDGKIVNELGHAKYYKDDQGKIYQIINGEKSYLY